jgi:acetyl-CoA C-acetyltransferase
MPAARRRGHEGGRFASSVVPVYKADGTLALDREEFPRPQTTHGNAGRPEAGVRRMADVAGSTKPAPPTAV